MNKLIFPIIGALFVTGCQMNLNSGGGTFREPNKIQIFRDGPEDAQDGTCWAKDESPAVIETVTVQIIERPAVKDANGAIVTPAKLRTETRQRVVEARDTIWFEAPCPEVFDQDFIASIQRGLALRDLYFGRAHGEMDLATQNAIRKFQKPMGLNSPVLSMVAARKLGLVAYSRDDIKKF